MSGLPAGRVAVIIATHAYCYPLEECIRGFAGQVHGARDIILVDNGSGGALAAWARGAVPDITILERRENGFFCGGYNEGIKEALSRGFDYALIVNADTEVCNDRLLTQLIDAGERHPKAAFIGPKVFLRQVGVVQNTVLAFPTFERAARAFIEIKALGREHLASDDQEKEVEFLNGVCVLCRSSALREIGLLDETMGGYVEDADWSWRARALGWASVYVPLPAVIHHQPQIGYEHHSMKSFMLRRNTIYWHVKRGAHVEAALYGWSSRFLAWIRSRWARLRRLPEASALARYSHRLREVDRRIRRREAPGEWFGPPLGEP